MYREVQQLRYSTSAAAADGLTREPAAYAQLLVRQLGCGSNLLQPLADLLTALRSPDAEVIAASSAAAGVIDLLERAMRGEVGSSDERAVQALAAVVMTRLMPHNGGAALARCITDKGALIIGQTRGCNGAAPLKAWSTAGHTCAGFLAEVASRAAALQAALASIRHAVTLDHTGEAVEDAAMELRRQTDAAIAVERSRRSALRPLPASDRADMELQAMIDMVSGAAGALERSAPAPLLCPCRLSAHATNACAGRLLREEKESSRRHVPLQLPQLQGGAAGMVHLRSSITGRVEEFVPSVQQLQDAAASAAADEEREGDNETSHVEVYLCANAMLLMQTADGHVIGVRITDVVSVSHSDDSAMAAAARAVAAFIPLLGQAPAPAAVASGCMHQQPCTCNSYDLQPLLHRPSVWQGGDAAAAGEVRWRQAQGDFDAGSWSASDVMETAGDKVACALGAAVARCCACWQTLVDRLRWRAIRRKIWKGQLRASAAAAEDAAAKVAEANEALAKLRPTAAAETRKAVAKAAQAAAAESAKAAAAAARAAQRGGNSCAESSADEGKSWFGWQEQADGAVSEGSEDSGGGAGDWNTIVSNARMQKAVSKINKGAGARALEAMKQQFLALPKGPMAAKSPFRHEQRFSLSAAAAHLQQSKPDRVAAIKARAARMAEIHLEINREAEKESSTIPEIQKQETKIVNAAAASLAPTSAPTAAPALVQPPHPARLRFPSLRLDPALALSATALRFFASVSSPHDVRCLVTDASLFVARHVRAYHKVWAPWEWQRLAEHEFMQQLQQSVPLLSDAGVAAAAAAAAVLATWPWWMPRLQNPSAFVERAVLGAIPAAVEQHAAASRVQSPPKKKKSPKKDGLKSPSQTTAAAVVKVATAQSLAAEVGERVKQLPVRHWLRQLMQRSVVQHGAALQACAAADERTAAAVSAAARAPPMQKQVLNAAAAAAQDDASRCKARLQSIALPPLLMWASARSTLHSLLSARDGRVLQPQREEDAASSSPAEMKEEDSGGLLHPALAATPHLAPFSFVENSTDPSFLAEAPVSWMLAMSAAATEEQLQCAQEELLLQWKKFSDEALQSPIPKKVGLADVPVAQTWRERMATLRTAHGAGGVPRPDALTVICWVVAARCCPLELRLNAAIAIVSVCSRICFVGIECKGVAQDTFPPFQKYRAQIASEDQPLHDEGGVPTTQLLHVCLHMLELCAAQGESKGGVQRAAADALTLWQRAGGRSTGQVCRCGSEANEPDARAQQGGITVENAGGRWWPVSFDWLDAWPAE